MGVNDLMILDLETLQEITGEVDQGARSDAAGSSSVSLQTETLPDLASIAGPASTAGQPSTAAVTPPALDDEVQESRAGGTGSFPKCRSFTLSDDSSERDEDRYRSPIARYSGFGVYSMPVQVGGDGQFHKGRDYPRGKDPEHDPVVVETNQFDLKALEADVRRRRRRLDDK